MIDITHKITTLRQAIAEATVQVSKPETIEAIHQNRVPKGDVLQTARVAGLFAAKKTSDIIPDCHPLPVEFTQVNYEFDGLSIKIKVEIRTIYRTGVEVEAMHAASVVALTLYDMLKPIDKNIEIQNIRLLSKKGGKSERTYTEPLQAAIIVCSDSTAQGHREDHSGQTLKNQLLQLNHKGHNIHLNQFLICPDELAQIQTAVLALCLQNIDIVILTGGTGLAKRDITPEAVAPLLERQIDGISETFRSYSQERLPTAMLSRAIAGLRGETLIVALPGSVSAVTDACNVLFPHILHIFELIRQSPASQHLD